PAEPLRGRGREQVERAGHTQTLVWPRLPRLECFPVKMRFWLAALVVAAAGCSQAGPAPTATPGAPTPAPAATSAAPPATSAPAPNVPPPTGTRPVPVVSPVRPAASPVAPAAARPCPTGPNPALHRVCPDS